MANDNYSEMTNRELVDAVEKLGLRKNKLKVMLAKHHQDLLNEIVRRTRFLDNSCVDENSWRIVPILARLYSLKHDLTQMPVCVNPKCHNVVFWCKGGSSFHHHCCKKCSNSDPKVQKKMEQMKFELYGDPHYVNPQKAKETNLEKYNAVNPMCLKEVQEKSKQTCMRNNGVEYPMQSKEIRDRQQNTMLERHGVRHPAQSHEIWEHTKQTNLERRGVEYTWLSKEVMNKSNQTCERKYGTLHPQRLESIKSKASNTNMLVYGCPSSFQNEDVRKKQRNKCLSIYGVEYYSQSLEYHKNKKHKFHSEKYPELTFDSKWEVKVYEFCMDRRIDVEYSPAISYEYEYDGRTWTYHPDFRINGRIYEIKGEQFFKVDESGHEVMFNPYRDPEWSDVRYAWECRKYEAKHQCMLANNVIILRKNDIKNLTLQTFSVAI